jgi:2-polyprenyl-6-hydroxyphenyl methylase / 3-demethylubiquinone-9 3-methyltransferase
MERLDEGELKAMYGATYAGQLDRRDHTRRLHSLIGKVELRDTYDVVDFGCGNGALLAVVLPRVRSYTGVDFSREFIDLARGRKDRLGAANAEFVWSSIEDFCATAVKRFDAAFAFDFSEHVYDDDWVRILGCIRQSIRPGGRLYLHTPNAEFVLELMKAQSFLLKQSREHVAVRDASHNIRLLEHAGYSECRAEYISHYNVLRFLHPLSYLPIVGRYLKARIFIEASVAQ